ncbi:MAG TPA: peptidylprolyl isomerase, partial [Polyangiales bacterium]|nr:peptidylprolyl isomerase [Polyangiales bacterium]
PADPAKPAEAQKPANSDPAGDGTQIIHTKNKDGTPAEIEVRPPPGWQVMTPPSSPDPHGGKFTLQEALKGLKGRGDLVATIATSMGEMHCDLYEDKTPNTVANFVGLARGLRKFWDGREWAARPYYDGLTFHRVIPGFMIQGGDLAGDGSGRVWYQIPDEVVPSLHHDRGGLLCMANRGPNTNEAQFFIMEAPAPHLDGSYTIFGACKPTEIVYRIARVPQDPSNNRPLSPVRIERISIARVEGGANAYPVSESDTSAPLPKNTVPGVAPPGRVVRGDKPPPQQ